jgi:FkbM family methyltransferase
MKYVGTNVNCWLFEPNPISFIEIRKELGKEPNFKLFNVVLGSERKKITLMLSHGSSFIEGIRSPLVTAEGDKALLRPKHEVEMYSIAEYDTGDIDELLIDTEGCEYDVIKSLISRPKKIVVEMYSFGCHYTNPHYQEILDWMLANGYRVTDQGEDFVFER